MHSIGDQWWQDPIFRKPGTWALIIMVISLAMLAAKVVSIVSKPPPYQLSAMNRTVLEQQLKSSQAQNTLVLFYDTQCKNCNTQIKQFLDIQRQQPEKSAILIISMDESAEKTANFLRDNNIPDSITTYYAAAETHEDLQRLLQDMGSGGITRLPHTVVTKPGGALLVEFSGYTRARDMQRTLTLFNTSSGTSP